MSDYILKSKTVKVRKRHTCIWCGEIIKIKEEALYRVYIFQNEFMSDYLHPECYSALLLWDDEYNDGFDAGIFERGKPFLKGGTE